MTPLTPAALPSPAAARYCGLAPKKFTNMRLLGEGPRDMRTGKKGSAVYYLVRDLDAWLEERFSGAIGGAA